MAMGCVAAKRFLTVVKVKTLRKRKRKTLMWALLGFVVLVWITLMYYEPSSFPYCLLGQKYRFNDKDIQPLEDVLLADHKPVRGKSIFFIETTCRWPSDLHVDAEGLVEAINNDGNIEMTSKANDHSVLTPALKMISLTARQACAIESAAFHNVNTDVYVLFFTTSYRSKTKVDPILEAVMSYPNVHLRSANLWTYVSNTPLQDWLNSGHLFSLRFPTEQISDYMRFLTLWRWGGTYLDTDVIVQKSLEDLSPNYSGAESETHVAAGVMNFSADNIGKHVVELCLYELVHHFDGKKYGASGPITITKIMEKICDTQDVPEMTTKRCSQFNIYPPEAFYAIPHERWTLFFEEQHLDECLTRVNNSYVAHFWNKLSGKRRIKIGTKCGYSVLAERHCPRVYNACKDFF